MDYQTLIVGAAADILTKVFQFVPTLFMALTLLIAGCVLVQVVYKFIIEFLKIIQIDMIFDKLKITDFFKKGGMIQRPSKMIASLFYILFMFVVLMITVKVCGFDMTMVMFDVILKFIPSLIEGMMILIVGMLIAKFVSMIVYIIAKNTDMPNPQILSRLAKLTILIYIGIVYLKQIGFLSLFEGDNYTILMVGVVFALALSFGLAGKAMAGKYLDVFSVKKD